QAPLNKGAAMGVDDQSWTLDVIREVQSAGHLTARTGQRQLALVPQGDRTLAKKCTDPVLCGAHLCDRCDGAIGCNQTSALQEPACANKLGMGPGCPVVHCPPSLSYPAARACSAGGVGVTAGRRGSTSFAISRMPFSASLWSRKPDRPIKMKWPNPPTFS